jgi:lipopolysaccharide export system permease protein
VTKILFVAPSPLGDALLTTGVLNYLITQNPEARVTVVCSPLNAPLFRASPQLERLIQIEKRRFALHWLDAYLKLANTRWDIVVDFRNVGIFHLLRAREAHRAMKRDFTIHKVEENARVLGVPPQDPKLWFDEEARAKADALMPRGERLIGFGPMSSSPYKEWQPERFADLAARLTAPGAPLAGAKIAVFAAEAERKRAGKLLALLPSERTLDLIGKTDALGAAACLQRLDLYVGNDSGLMHLAAAAGTPTLGLFGTGWPTVYRPWGPRAAYIERRVTDTKDAWRRMTLEQMAGLAMVDIDVDTVVASARQLLAKSALHEAGQ